MTEPITRSASGEWNFEWPEGDILIRLSSGQKAPEVTSTGLYRWSIVPGSAPVTGTITCGQRAIACRIEPSSRPDLIQSQYGEPVTNTRLDALFNPDTDTVLRVTGGALKPDQNNLWTLSSLSPSQVIELQIIPDYFKTIHKFRYYKPIDKTFFRYPPSGWCSWYYYFTELGEQDVLANAEWMARELKPFGAEYVQLDDGWQGEGAGGGWNRDWFVIAPDFPHGMRWLADRIRDLGMKPGLWSAPFGQSSDYLFKKDPEMWLRDAEGKTVGVYADGGIHWVGHYLLDPSNPRSQAYLRDMFRMFADWGYEYFKIDGQADMSVFYTQCHDQLYNSSISEPDEKALGPREPRASDKQLYGKQHEADGEVYRLGLAAIREGIGPHRFLLGCGGTPLVNGIGFTDGSRTGGDVGADWGGIQAALRAIQRGYYLHNIVWYSDPDVLCVRPPLSMDEACLWTSLMGLSGQILMVSDNMPALPPERVELLRRVFPAADVVPSDLFPLTVYPAIWDTRIKTDAGEWDVIGLFNYEKEARTVSVTLAELGLPDVAEGYVAYDYWNRRYLGKLAGPDLTAELAPHACCVLALHAAKPHPQVVSTSRHLLQGALDLHKVKWDEDQLSLSGVSDVVANDAYELRIAVPANYLFDAVEIAGVRSRGMAMDGLLVIIIESGQSMPVEWRVRFKRQS